VLPYRNGHERVKWNKVAHYMINYDLFVGKAMSRGFESEKINSEY